MAKIDDFTKEIMKALADYTEEIEDELDEIKDDVSKDLVKNLKSDSPEDSGEYASGWGRTKDKNGDYIVYNKKKPQLTHLLEHGHVNRDGGRTPAQVHIRPNEEMAIKEFEKRVEKAIKG